MKAGGMLRLIGAAAYGLILLAIGLVMAWWGGELLMLGGSPYYLPAGIAAVASGAAVFTGRWRLGGWIFLALMIVTLIWSLAEAGLDGWALMPRLLSPFVLGLPFLVLALARGRGAPRWAGLATLAAAIVLVVAVGSTSGYEPPASAQRQAVAHGADPDGDWAHFGGTSEGRHFSHPNRYAIELQNGTSTARLVDES